MGLGTVSEATEVAVRPASEVGGAGGGVALLVAFAVAYSGAEVGTLVRVIWGVISDRVVTALVGAKVSAIVSPVGAMAAVDLANVNGLIRIEKMTKKLRVV
jgi:hypothetical protein